MRKQPTHFASALHELWIHRRLLKQFSLRNLELRHRGSLLGFLWNFINPLLLLGIYVTVFGYIFEGNFPDDPIGTKASYALTIFLGLTLFHLFAEVAALSPSTVIGNPNLVKKVLFPLAVLPAAAVATALINFLISLLLAAVAAQLLGTPIWTQLGWLLFIVFPIFLLCAGLAFALSAIGVFIRDVSQITQSANLVLLYASAIFYPVSSIPSQAWGVLRLNPLLHIVEESRRVVFWNHSPNWIHLGYCYAFGLVSLFWGAYLFQKLRKRFADTL